MKPPRLIRDAAIALTTLTALPTPPEWLAKGPSQAAGWFPAVGGIIGAAGYFLIKAAEAVGLVDAAPYLVAVAVVALWTLLTWGLHSRSLTSVIEALLQRVGVGGAASPRDVSAHPGANTPSPDEPQTGDAAARRRHALAAGVVALVAAGEAAVIGSFLVAHQSPVLSIPLLARVAATAAAWLGKPVDPEGEGGALFGHPTLVSAIVAAGAVALAALTLRTGFGVSGLRLTGVGVFIALAVPHLLSLAFDGVTLDVMEASVAVAEVAIFVAFVVLH